MGSLGDRLAQAAQTSVEGEPVDHTDVQAMAQDLVAQATAPPPPPPPPAAPTHSTERAPRAEESSESGLGKRMASPSGATVEDGTRRRSFAHSAKDRIDELKAHIHSELLKQLGPQLYDVNMDQLELEKRVREVLKDVLGSQERPLSGADRAQVTQEITDDILGNGPIEPYLRDDDVTEVMVNGHDSIFLEKRGRLTKAEATFTDEAHLRRTIDKIVSRIGRRVDESSPMVDARLPDGSRVNAVVPPLAIDGSCLTIRKFAADPYTAADLVQFGSMSQRTCDFLDACVRGRLNIVVSGSTGAGKTTTLNVLSSFIPSDERIVTIEDAAELQLHQEHVVRLESRPANIEGKGAVHIRDLVKNSLRMRPDRIIVGEVRDASALDMLQAMNTGHDGSICTVHSNGPRDTLARVETMVLMAGMDLPVRAIREQVASAVDLIVHQARFKDGSRHITHVTEVERMEGDVITLQDIFLYDHSAGFDADGRSRGSLKATGLRPKFLEKMSHANVTVDPRLFAMDGF
jgi:pilus assembly protein CpaF